MGKCGSGRREKGRVVGMNYTPFHNLKTVGHPTLRTTYTSILHLPPSIPSPEALTSTNC